MRICGLNRSRGGLFRPKLGEAGVEQGDNWAPSPTAAAAGRGVISGSAIVERIVDPAALAAFVGEMKAATRR